MKSPTKNKSFDSVFRALEKAMTEAKALADYFEQKYPDRDIRTSQCSDAFSLEHDIGHLIEAYSHRKGESDQ